MIDNKEVSNNSIYVFKADHSGNYTLQLTVASEAGSQTQTINILVKEGKYKYGTFILNEGFVGTHGSLIYISPNRCV